MYMHLIYGGLIYLFFCSMLSATLHPELSNPNQPSLCTLIPIKYCTPRTPRLYTNLKTVLA